MKIHNMDSTQKSQPNFKKGILTKKAVKSPYRSLALPEHPYDINLQTVKKSFRIPKNPYNFRSSKEWDELESNRKINHNNISQEKKPK